MSDVNILPPLLTRIGLNENDIKIYTTVLGLGKATIGEIMVITQLDALSTVQSVKNLEEIGFLKKIKGLTPQYLAVFPFLKQYITVERDTLYAIEGIINSLKKDATSYQEKRKQFGGKLDNSSDEHIFDIHIVSGLIKQLTDSVNSQFVEMSETIENESFKILDETVNLISKEIAEAQNQSIAISLRMESYLKELDAFIKQFEHSAKKRSELNKNNIEQQLSVDFSELFKILKNGLESHTENHKDFLDKFAPELDNVLKEHLNYANELQEEFLKKYRGIWEDTFEAWVKESRILAESLQQNINVILTEQTRQTQELRRSVEQIDRNINKLSSTIVDALHLAEDLKKKKASPLIEKLQEVRDGMRSLANNFSESGLQIVDQHVLKINETKDKLREKIDHFQLNGATSIKTKKSQIIAETTEKTELLPDELLNKIQNEVEKYVLSSYDSCKEVSSNLIKTISESMDNTSSNIIGNIQQFHDEHSKTMIDFKNEVNTELNKTKEDIQKIGGDFKEKLAVFDKDFANKVIKTKEEIANHINDDMKIMEEKTEKIKEQLTSKIIEAEEVQIDTIVAQVASVIKDVDEAIMEKLASLREKASAYYQVINTREDELKQIDKAANSVNIKGHHNVSVIVGEEAILASLTDLSMRASRELLVITPYLEESLLEEMAMFTKANRVTLVSDFSSGKFRNALINLKERFVGLKLRQYDKKDVFCGIKDGFDEAIFAFLVPDAVPVAIRTDNELLLQMFKAAVNRDVMFHTHDYEL
ncbi:MAG: hypothetical protein K9W46_08090 [Candidatus Heimdallarchaeum endolithica]|uniref:Transcription regulator TrmB N-terminal domain-containing protein n=1 Tax=Candidatus Heimdallarchaeum endolithica TaxID=2876572 RepID=A0A9Y1BP50_9ARCH|nr:MAG: hypothetical protein K9W46_08090 [Candidatus Heimdallarchaeum endolithica]